MSTLAVRGLDAGYEDFQALFGVSLDLAAGETVALVGANGAGKTTLLMTIAGALRPWRGGITLDGTDVTGQPALVVTGGLSVLLRYTAWGRRVRATSDDQAIARLQGIRVRPLFASVTGIAIAAAALAGTLNAVTTGVYPTLGALTLIFAFEAVIIGGLGSLWGTLLGGMVLGITQVVVSQVSVPYAILASQLLFLVVLAARPQGLFGNPQIVG
jgi:branched-chain amino acid transport system permease protein